MGCSCSTTDDILLAKNYSELADILEETCRRLERDSIGVCTRQESPCKFMNQYISECNETSNILRSLPNNRLNYEEFDKFKDLLNKCYFTIQTKDFDNYNIIKLELNNYIETKFIHSLGLKV